MMKLTKRSAMSLAAIAALSLSACSGGGGWPQAEIDKMMSGCPDAMKEQCSCMVDAVQENLTYAQWEEIQKTGGIESVSDEEEEAIKTKVQEATKSCFDGELPK